MLRGATRPPLRSLLLRLMEPSADGAWLSVSSGIPNSAIFSSGPAARLLCFRLSQHISWHNTRADCSADCRGGFGGLRQWLIAGMGPQIFLRELALGI